MLLDDTLPVVPMTSNGKSSAEAEQAAEEALKELFGEDVLNPKSVKED